ncbi:MAG: hypothetical protein MUF58_06920 [Arcicella sp.]|jgi:hypothetical protein|nr:hypothetical protein [Arcicella sp.]
MDYTTKDKNAYLRVFNESKESDFKFDGDFTNNLGDKISTYKKGTYSISLGYFTSTHEYLFALQDDSKIVAVPDFLPASFLVGSWGRVSTSHSGKYTFFENNTFSFEDSYDGRITGKWRTEKKEILLNYDKKIKEYDINHGLSIVTEIIHVTNKQANTIDGYLDNNQYRTITLSRQ